MTPPLKQHAVEAARHRRGSGRVACSGRARAVLDHIDKYADGERPLRRSTLPLTPYDHFGELILPYPLDAEEWGRLMALLSAMRPGLVADARPQRRRREKP